MNRAAVALAPSTRKVVTLMIRRSWPFLACQLVGAVLWWSAPPAAAVTLEQEVQAGRTFVQAFVDSCGLSENQKYRELGESVLARLVRASGERPELTWRLVVLKHNPQSPIARNASAWPGGHIVTDDAFFELLEKGAAGDAARLEAMVAGVLAHEMAHIIRHDTDALVTLYLKDPAAPTPQILFSLKATDDLPKAGAAETRAAENESDRHGAFYLLRAGYRIEDMIGVFRRLADEEVDERLFSSELTHARAAERVGNLLEVQGQVVEDERLYDEAVNILRLGLGEEMLRIAERNLEVVSARFPRVLPVRHARAVLLHRRFLQKASPQDLQFNPSFSFYRFREVTRSLFGEDYLEQAIREYEAILKDYEAEGHRGLGPTVAAYALALAQNNQAEKARPWAEKAVQLAPEDWSAHNVLGIVQAKLRDHAAAAQSFRKALALAVTADPKGLVDRAFLNPSMEERAVWRYIATQPPAEYGPALFNLGVVLRDADQAASAQAFRAYLALDSRTGWADEARRYLGSRASEGVAASPVAGLTVGMPDTDLRKRAGDAAIGTPPSPGTQVWRYKEKGFTAFLDDTGRLRAMLLYAPFAGQVGAGVVLGSSPDQVEKAWGKPLVTAQTSDREAWVYPAHGLTFLFTGRKLTRVVWAPAPPPGAAVVEASVPVRPGDTAAQVEKALGGPPETGKGEETQGGVWAYDRLGVRIRFDREGKVALVTITRPSAAAVAGVRLGDPPARIRQAVGNGVTTSDVDNSETYAFPEQGVAFVVRNAEVTAITLFPKETRG